MTSLEAQNHFGEMIDTSQREPVLITRRGRPVSVVISTSGNQADTMLQLMKFLGKLSPMANESVTTAYEAYRNKVGNLAEEKGLTEDQIVTMVHDSR
jgi:prevent-host-death family protein